MTSGAQAEGEIRDLLARHGLRPRKSMGQHFLIDRNIVAKTVALAGLEPGERVVEIGAGTGTLTRAISDGGTSVLAYEVDPRLRPLLQEVLADRANVELVFEDASRSDFSVLLEGGPWVLVANLPYHVGIPLLLDMVQSAFQVSRFIVMVQREVAQRLEASPGGKDYGVPSVVASLYTTTVDSFRVPPTVFYPRPSVDSTVLRLDRIAAPDPDNRARAVSLAKAAFGKRRKMLRRSLEDALPNPEAVLTKARLDPTARAEDLSPQDYLDMATTDVG